MQLKQLYKNQFMVLFATEMQNAPTVTDIKELQKNKEYVGCQQGSFVKELLIKNNFDEDRLKQYNSSAECIDVLSKGSANGGIAAAFDEIPYVKLLQAINCLKYAKVGTTYKSDDFGFVSNSFVLTVIFF
ncbi:glutamate receptor 2.9 [Nicotiana attenuata]|uniref:Glutamate receptor 2.9 n=1 Tax=Nicotiana attenuata TaxID=49451 RepID=A0A1J6JDH5_NICAT|nr:glutamate receptor 2.9 [Nicotiana attenuata]